MSRKHFSWLLAVTIAAVVVIGLLPEQIGREGVVETRLLLPGFAERVNELDRIEIIRAGEQPVATLRRSPDGWTVDEAGGYPVDWPRLRTLLAALAQAQVIESKTSNPQYFDRLGLRDVADEDSDAVLVRLGTGADAPAVLVGNSARNQEGQYVRLANEDRAWLVDRALDVPVQSRDWLNRQIVDIGETEVVEVGITHPDGERVLLNKTSADDADFQLQDVPDGREVQSSWTINAPGGGLAGLRLEDVRRAEDVPFGDPVQLRVLTADGVQIDAELAAHDEKFWIRLTAAAYAQSESAAPAESAAGGGEMADDVPEAGARNADAGEVTPADETGEAGEAGAGEVGHPGPAERAAAINDRVAGWVYAIPKYKYDVLTRRLEDLLRQPESAD